MPSDEELNAMTGMNVFTEGAVIDRQILESWMEQGFSREEAFQLLLCIKNKAPQRIINYDGGTADE